MAKRKTVKAILPDELRFHTARRGKKMTIHYEEVFRHLVSGHGSKASRAKVVNLTDTLRRFIDPRIRITHSIRRGVVRFHLSGTVDRTVIGNMLVGEFLAWTTMADLKLRDLIVAGVLYNAHVMKKNL
jgi:hypothetical protein